MFRSLARVAAFLLLLLLLSGASEHSRPVAAQQSYPTSVSKIESASAENAASDWPMYGHDPQHTNFNPAETEIGASNVDQLVRRWRYRIGSSGTPGSSAPTVANGRVFIGSSVIGSDNFFAIDAANGQWLWSANLGNTATCLPVGLGSSAAVQGDRLVVGGGDRAYYGLSASTGQILWRTPLNAGPTGFAWSSPLFIGNHAYFGAASECSNPPVRGEVREVDVETGQQVANLYMVPEGHRGGGIWHSPALNPSGTKMVATTGEDGDDFTGAYTRSIVVFDPQTFQVLGSHQTGTAGIDFDWASSPIIFHDRNGREMTGAIHKDGVFYAYDINNVSAGPVWTRSTGVAIGMMPGYDPTFGAGGTVYAATNNRLFAFDPETGQDRWTPLSIGSPNGNMAIANGLIFFNINGALYIVDGHEGRLARVITPRNAGCSLNGPVVANGLVYWQSGLYLNAWGLPPANSTPTRTPVDTPVPVATSTPGATSTPCALGFSDIESSAYYYEAVRYLSCNTVISGYSDNTFRPFNDTTRGQLAKIVVLAFGFPIIVPPEESFIDVPFDSPFFLYIETIASRGIVSGYCDGSFRPWASITRGQISKIIVAAAGWEVVRPATPTFSDVTTNNTFYAEIETAYAHGIVSGYSDGTFKWVSRATRGQISKIIYQTLNSGVSK